MRNALIIGLSALATYTAGSKLFDDNPVFIQDKPSTSIAIFEGSKDHCRIYWADGGTQDDQSPTCKALIEIKAVPRYQP